MEERHMLVLPMQVNERLWLMPIVTAGQDAGHDHNKHHSPVDSQQGILDDYRKVPSVPQEGAHICSCAEYLLEQLKRVHRQ
jgi:hypothetical protein